MDVYNTGFEILKKIGIAMFFALQMFYEKGNTLNRFAKPKRYTDILVSQTKCKLKLFLLQ